MASSTLLPDPPAKPAAHRPPLSAIRGLMWDMARLTERFDAYMKLPERAAELGYNALFAHLIDDEGCAIRFDSHPEFSSPYAFTKEQVGDWVAEAERCGHLVVPEIECFGHTGYIHRQPRYEHLALIGSDSLNAIDPTHPETREVFRDLIAEVASLFGGPWMHLGFDEVDPGTGHALHAPRADADWDDLFVEHLAFAQGEAERHGKRALIWADHLLANPKLAERVSRDVLLCDWQYAIDVDGSTTVRLRDAGFDVLACPASNRAMEVVVPGRNTLGNLARTAGFAHAQTPRIGTVNTFWCPQRMLMGAADFALYLGGRWAQTPHLTEAEGLAAYAADWHGLAADAAAEAGAAIGRLSELTLNRTEWRDLLGTHPLSRPAPPAEDPAAAAATDDRLAGLAAAREALDRHRPGVTRHAATFEAYALACDVIGWTLRVGRARAAVDAAACARLADAGRALLERCERNWAENCHADDPKKTRDALAGGESVIPVLTAAVALLDAASAA